MKKILLITLLLIPFLGFSQTTKPIDGFLGIKFGSSKAVVLAVMKAKGAVLNEKIGNANNLAFNRVKLGLKDAALLVRFVNNKAFEADYFFVPDVEAKIIETYDDLVTDVINKYGNGQATKQFNPPYAEDESDGDTLLGLSAGKINFQTDWSDDKKNSIEIIITTDMNVKLIYQDGVLTNEAIALQNAKQQKDF